MMNESTRTAAAGSGPADPAAGKGKSRTAAAGSGAGEPAEPAAITGEQRVDEALARLASLGDQPGAGHVEAFEHVNQSLHSLLDELGTPSSTGEAPGGQADQA